MVEKGKYYCGIDVGTSSTKLALLDAQGNIVASSVEKTGIAAESVAAKSLENALDSLGISRDDVVGIITTGYARNDVDFADGSITEISCHARGCLKYYEGPYIIIDIGGQDNKTIRLNEYGKRVGFKLNRKCASGTGTFIEEIANIINVPISEMNALAETAENPVKLGSFCTVFTKTEILTNFRHGDRLADIAAGVFQSVAKRVMEMDTMDLDVVMTGGVVAHNPCIVDIFGEMSGCNVKVPALPQLTGAIGAALYAMDRDLAEKPA